jgi:hypothetical protein
MKKRAHFGERVFSLWGLSRVAAAPFLSRVTEHYSTTALPRDHRGPDRVAAAIAGSALVAATVLGLLMGFGRRHGTFWQPLNVSAHMLIGERAEGVFGFQSNVTLAGVAVVLVMSAVAACVTAMLTSSRRILHRAMTVIGVVLLAYIVHLHIVARSPGGLAALLDVGELRALYVAVAIALMSGMRYAFSDSAGASLNT